MTRPRNQLVAHQRPGDGFVLNLALGRADTALAKLCVKTDLIHKYVQTGGMHHNITCLTPYRPQHRDICIIRVAAYCRVSTDDIDQLVSIEMQKNAYRDMIRANPKWKHVGTYVEM